MQQLGNTASAPHTLLAEDWQSQWQSFYCTWLAWSLSRLSVAPSMRRYGTPRQLPKPPSNAFASLFITSLHTSACYKSW